MNRFSTLNVSYAVNLINLEIFGSARGVMFIVVGSGHGDTSSNPGQS